MSSSSTYILKFGGTSLQNETYIKQSVQIVLDHAKTAMPVVVVSALAGVTDTLIWLASETRYSQTVEEKIDTLLQKHVELFDLLARPDDHRREQLQQLFAELKQSISNQPKELTQRRIRKDRILSIGERASALIFATAIAKQGHTATAFEASNFIKTDATFGAAVVQTDATRSLVRQFLQQSTTIPVVTGFIGSDDHDRITTLGRSGSDYTAGLLADALEADHLEIWTDVDGVLSADPRWVPSAEPIAKLSFADIGELAAHGANVIHPKTIRPITNKNTSVLVKNSYNPSHPGTLINKQHKSNGAFKTITISGPFVRLDVEDAHALNLLDRLRGWLTDETDAEAWSFSRKSAFEPARLLVRQSLFENINPALEKWATDCGISLTPQTNLYKVKKFSNHFNVNEKFTGRIWDLLAAKNLRSIQTNRNRDERFISFLFKEKEAKRAARLMNDFLQADKTCVDLFVAGTGAVGNTLLKQLDDIDTADFNFRLLGKCNSRKAYWNKRGVDSQSQPNWANSKKTNWENIIEQLTQPHRHNLIFVDATGNEQVARLYPKLFEAGIHVVTPSKLANTFEQSFFDELQLTATQNNTIFKYETTVGAGLPVISTLNNLQKSGDRINEVSGVVSGTMTYLFNQLEQGVSFSEAIIDARERGYAEPDPRDDLSGEDVARKFLTIARTLGYKIERNELEVESLIPEALTTTDRSTFLQKLKKYDAQWQEKIDKADQKGETLRYTGRLKNGRISIGIESVAKNSALGQLKGTDNLIQIYSRHYNQTPLVIQGAGAGKEVTAAGVLSDILKVADRID